MAVIGIDEIITTWNLKTGGSVQSAKELAKEMRGVKKETRETAEAQEWYAAATGQAAGAANRYTAALRNMTRGFTAQFAAGNLVSMGLTKIMGIMGDIATETNAFTMAQRQFTGDLALASEAAGGLARDLDLLQAKNRLDTLGVKMNSEQYAKLVGTLTRVSTAMGKDLKTSIEAATVALARQSTLRADDVGVIMSVTTANEAWADSHNKVVSAMTDGEKRIAFQEEFLRKLGVAAEQSVPRVQTFGDVFTVGLNRVWNGTLRLTDAFNTGYVPALQSASHTIAGWTDHLKATIDPMGAMEENTRLAAEQTRMLKEETEALTKAVDEAGKELISFQPILLAVYGDGDTTSRQGGQLKEFTEQLTGARYELTGPGGGKGFKMPGKKGAAGAGEKLPEWGLNTKGDAQLAEMEAMLALTDATQKYNEVAREERAVVGDVISAYRDKMAALNKSVEALDATKTAEEVWNDRQRALIKSADATSAAIKGSYDLATGAMASFAGGIWEAADSAMAGEQAMGQAMMLGLKQTMMRIASEATVMSLMALARYAWSWGADAGALSAAGMYATAAALAGGIGLGMGAAGVGRSSKDGARESSRADNTSRPSFGERKQKEQQTLVVNLYLDPNDPSSQLIAGRKITSMTQQALGM